MCDILALVAGTNHGAGQYLPVFAEKAKGNMSGWGIGFIHDDQAVIERSSESVHNGEHVHESFQRLARVVDSRIIVSQVSCPLSGMAHATPSRPLSLSFLDHVWLFVHAGLADGMESYQTTHEPRIDAEGVSARVFEYLRDQLMSYLRYTPYSSVTASLARSIQNMISDYPGQYAFFLANESTLLAFSNSRPLMLLQKPPTLGNNLVLTSIAEGLSEEAWIAIRPEENGMGKLVVVAGPDVLYLEDVPEGSVHSD